MFSIQCNDLRYVVSCMIKKDKIKADVDTIVDTGARYTCYVAKYISPDLHLFNFTNVEFKRLGGLISDKEKEKEQEKKKKNKNKDDDKIDTNLSAVFYRYEVDDFKIGNIHLGKQTIWITFDKKVKDDLLGLDILSQITYLHEANLDNLYLFQNRAELNDYIMQTLSDKSLKELVEENNKLKEQIEMLREYNRSLLIRNKTTK